MNQPIKINVVVWRDGDRWIAQGLEFDIAAYAAGLDDLQFQFERAIAGHALAACAANEDPLLGIPPAPQKFWDMHRSGREVELRPVSRFIIQDGRHYTPGLQIEKLALANVS